MRRGYVIAIVVAVAMALGVAAQEPAPVAARSSTLQIEAGPVRVAVTLKI